jgi:hypothetical protein
MSDELKQEITSISKEFASGFKETNKEVERLQNITPIVRAAENAAVEAERSRLRGLVDELRKTHQRRADGDHDSYELGCVRACKEVLSLLSDTAHETKDK